jgi:hypothetical protein
MFEPSAVAYEVATFISLSAATVLAVLELTL